jgi:hypothetical protein
VGVLGWVGGPHPGVFWARGVGVNIVAWNAMSLLQQRVDGLWRRYRMTTVATCNSNHRMR